MAIKNLIFDVDGTLWDVTETLSIAWSEAASKTLNKEVFLSKEAIQKELGKTMEDIGKSLFASEDSQMQEKLIESCIKYEHEYLEKMGGKFYPQVLETLSHLKDDYNLYIVSNAQSGYIELLLEKGNLQDIIIDHLAYGDTGKGKDYNIAKIIEKHNLNKEETLYLGDILADQEASHKAGIKMIHCSYGFGVIENPDYVIKSMSELPNFLKSI